MLNETVSFQLGDKYLDWIKIISQNDNFYFITGICDDPEFQNKITIHSEIKGYRQAHLKDLSGDYASSTLIKIKSPLTYHHPLCSSHITVPSQLRDKECEDSSIVIDLSDVIDFDNKGIQVAFDLLPIDDFLFLKSKEIIDLIYSYEGMTGYSYLLGYQILKLGNFGYLYLRVSGMKKPLSSADNHLLQIRKGYDLERKELEMKNPSQKEKEEAIVNAQKCANNGTWIDKSKELSNVSGELFGLSSQTIAIIKSGNEEKIENHKLKIKNMIDGINSVEAYLQDYAGGF